MANRTSNHFFFITMPLATSANYNHENFKGLVTYHANAKVLPQNIVLLQYF